MCFIISCICVYYYDYLYVCYMLDIGERAIELMFSVYCHTDENNSSSCPLGRNVSKCDVNFTGSIGKPHPVTRTAK